MSDYVTRNELLQVHILYEKSKLEPEPQEVQEEDTDSRCEWWDQRSPGQRLVVLVVVLGIVLGIMAAAGLFSQYWLQLV